MAQEITNNRGKRKERKGVVISKMGNKSIRVLTETRKPHPVYGKVLTYKKTFHVHDEENKAIVGDEVVIVESRPISRLKRWRLVEVLKKELK